MTDSAIAPQGAAAHAPEEACEQEAHEQPGASVTDRRGTGTVSRPQRLIVAAATMLFFATCLGFLITTPTGFSPDEPFQFDRVMAAWAGEVILDPEGINVSRGSRGIEVAYWRPYTRNGPGWADAIPTLRQDRPSFNDVGGNARPLQQNVSNYMTQHPPLYYGLLGGLTRLVPGAADMPADGLYMLIRFFNVLLLVPLPFLFWFSARQLVGPTSVAAAAAFLPMLVPGIARIAASINNDSLAIVLGAAIVALSIRVMRGDNGFRTAALLAALAVAGSLTKATILFILVVIPIAYGVQAFRARAWPSKPVIGILLAGAVGAAGWWVRNLVRFGAVQPNAWGAQFARAQGPVRTADMPVDMDLFWRYVADKMPSRLFAALGRLEPPQLPSLMVSILTVVVLVAIPIAVAVLPRRRWDLAVIVALPLASLAMVLFQVYRHYLSYVTFAGAQGRYAYPSIFGLLFPVAVVLGALLGRYRRWAPLLVAAGGITVSGWALYVSVEYFWVHQGDRLEPSNWSAAISRLAGFSPLPGLVTGALGVMMVGLVLAATAMAVLGCLRDRDAGAPGDHGDGQAGAGPLFTPESRRPVAGRVLPSRGRAGSADVAPAPTARRPAGSACRPAPSWAATPAPIPRIGPPVSDPRRACDGRR